MKLYGTLKPKRAYQPGGVSRGQSGFGMATTANIFADWNCTHVTNDALLASQLLPMRNRARQLARDEDYFKAFLRACRNNIIGPNGVSLQMDIQNPPKPEKTEDGSIEWVENPDELANEAVEAAYKEFSKPQTMNATGQMIPAFTTSGKFGRTQFGHLGVTTAARDGEFFYRVIRDFANPWGLSIQPINPDYIDELKNETRADGVEIRMGIQKNKWGQTTHYWLRTWNPGDTYWTGKGAHGGYKSEPVPASEIRHFYAPDDFDLSRGYPWIHAGATRLKMLAGYEEAALEAARAAACKHEVWERPMDSNGEFKGDATDENGNIVEDVEPGQREIAPLGWKLNAIDPRYPHSEHGGFINTTIGGVCAGLGASRLTITGDLSQANYSSMRAGLLPERDEWMVLQGLWITQVEIPIFFEWLTMALLKGAITTVTGKKLPAERFEKFAKPVFQGRRWPWVDPVKDQDANAIALEQRITTRSAIVSQSGGDLREIARTISRERKMYANQGITLPEDAAAASMEAKAEPEPEDEEESVETEKE